MIKFILSNSFNNIDNNLELIKNNNYNNLFWGVETEIPFSIYNGKINNNYYSIFLSYDYIDAQIHTYKEISDNMMIFDFGNLLLEENDYEDTLGEVIFESYVNKQNIFFEIADIKFIDFLVNKYPSIQIILHENYTIFHKEEEIKSVLEKYSNNIKAINISILNLCENIEYSKIGILNLDSCFYCPQYPLCLKTEHKNILRYREASIFTECTKKKMISINNILKNLSLLLKHTDIILFNNFSLNQVESYMQLIETVLEKEEEVNQNEEL